MLAGMLAGGPSAECVDGVAASSVDDPCCCCCCICAAGLIGAEPPIMKFLFLFLRELAS